MVKKALLFNVLNLKLLGHYCSHQIQKLVGNVRVEECVSSRCHITHSFKKITNIY